jgi:ABC-type uncharacterized transport system substrate-binding protein
MLYHYIIAGEYRESQPRISIAWSKFSDSGGSSAGLTAATKSFKVGQMQFPNTVMAAVLAGLVWLGAPAAALAHPHVWVVVETEIAYDGQKAITAFRHKWRFDEAYSAFAVEGLDKNGDGKHDRAELQELAEVNVNSLKDFGYFTFPTVAGKPVEALPPRDYWLEHVDGTLILHLTLPLKEPLDPAKHKDFRFAVYDPSFYVEFALARETPVRLSAAPAGCAPVIKEPDPQAAQAAAAALAQADQSIATVDTPAQDASLYAKSVSIACTAG